MTELALGLWQQGKSRREQVKSYPLCHEFLAIIGRQMGPMRAKRILHCAPAWPTFTAPSTLHASGPGCHPCNRSSGTLVVTHHYHKRRQSPAWPAHRMRGRAIAGSLYTRALSQQTTVIMAPTASLERMATLAHEITEKTKIITDYLSSNGLEAASFDVNGLAEFPVSPKDEEPYQARLELISLTKELHDISVGPKEGLRYLAWDVGASL